jgi:hypothetical protein
MAEMSRNATLADIQQLEKRWMTRFEKMDDRLDKIDERFSNMEARMLNARATSRWHDIFPVGVFDPLAEAGSRFRMPSQDYYYCISLISKF